MVEHDRETLAFYAREAETYAAATKGGAPAWRDRFAALLPPGGAVLELGCGGGGDAADFIARGFAVTPTDGTPEMAAVAERRLGRPVQVLRFDELDAVGRYDGIWANACLLHAPAAALPAVFARIYRALRSGGVFYASFKAGDGEARDRLGRHYSYVSPERLGTLLTGAGAWQTVELGQTRGTGYEGTPADWLHLLAVRATAA